VKENTSLHLDKNGVKTKDSSWCPGDLRNGFNKWNFKNYIDSTQIKPMAIPFQFICTINIKMKDNNIQT
jgi:hypothetical protein